MNDVRIYFAGVNTSPLCEAFAGFRVLETFADIRRVLDRYRPTFKSMCLDSGAYSEMASGKAIDLEEYIDYCQQHGAFYDFIAALDSIAGGPDVNLKNWQRMLDRGVAAIPTYHQGEPWSVLQDYVKSSRMVGLGFQRPIKNAVPYLTEAFSHIPDDVLVHGWGMTNYTQFPFHSVDSRTWFFEVQALKAVKGQGAASLRCLTNGELIEIVQKKYLRLARQCQWENTDVETVDPSDKEAA